MKQSGDVEGLKRGFPTPKLCALTSPCATGFINDSVNSDFYELRVVSTRAH